MPESPSIPSTVDPAIVLLRAWYARVGTASGILDQHAELFENISPGEGESFPFPLVRPKEVRSSADIRVMCETILSYVWHFGEYIKHVLRENRGLTEKQAKKVIDGHIENSDCLQRIAFLVNSAKHVVADRSWGKEIAPKLGDPVILAPDGYGTYAGVSGEGWSDLQGSFTGPIIQSVEVTDARGTMYNDARWHAEYGAASWLALLNRLGIDGWANLEIQKLVTAVLGGLAREQSRTGEPRTKVRIRIESIKENAKLLVKCTRTPPVLLMFPRMTYSLTSPYHRDGSQYIVCAPPM